MPQAHCFLATELMLKAQKQAQRRRSTPERGCTRSNEDTHGARPSRRAFLTSCRHGARGGDPCGRLPGDRARLGVRQQRAEQPDQHRRDRHGPHLERPRPAGHLEARDGARSWPSAISTATASRTPNARQRLLHEEDRETVRRRHRIRRLSRAPREQGRRRRRHQHARSLARLIAIHAVEAGKDVYLQKPASLTIAEGRALSNAVHRSGRIFQIGSQQRSSPQFRYAAELVRNGRIGQLKTVEVGLPGDPSGDVEPEMPVPKNLNYDTWLGSTPYVYYTEKRVHPQSGLRPSRLAAMRAVRRRHDHRLGRSSRRQRALGNGHGVHRPGGDLGYGGIPEERAVGRPRAVQDRGGSTPTA